ncbi:hypothetical protein D9611_006987 [Ephemerocybe angulata]|uniref:Uncharacterized protein n=1 Tax=Ephemerocybe angulata TaxID=980116 RepID=A0A8H5AZY8_9AGAR|nr:hypothetical protein D9611_006987 [Tulosesus angulatus]
MPITRAMTAHTRNSPIKKISTEKDTDTDLGHPTSASHQARRERKQSTSNTDGAEPNQGATEATTVASKEYILLECTFLDPNGPAKVSMASLIDSGATNCYMDTDFATMYGLPLQTLPTPVKLYNADGSENAGGDILATCTVAMKVLSHIETITFYTTSIKYPVVLGYSWLSKHNPDINWTTKEVHLNNCGECERTEATPMADTNSPYLGGTLTHPPAPLSFDSEKSASRVFEELEEHTFVKEARSRQDDGPSNNQRGRKTIGEKLRERKRSGGNRPARITRRSNRREKVM